MSDEHRLKISEALKGKKPKNLDSLRRPEINIKRNMAVSKAKMGVKLSSSHVDSIRKSHQGLRPSAEAHRKAIETRKGNKLTKVHRLRISEAHKKNVLAGKHHSWKGGISPINKLIRRSVEYKLWREAVFKRDDWTCTECKIRGTELHPDHIKPFALFPKLRFELSNGRTLCVPCHKKTDTYGYKKMYSSGTGRDNSNNSGSKEDLEPPF